MSKLENTKIHKDGLYNKLHPLCKFYLSVGEIIRLPTTIFSNSTFLGEKSLFYVLVPQKLFPRENVPRKSIKNKLYTITTFVHSRYLLVFNTSL